MSSEETKVQPEGDEGARDAEPGASEEKRERERTFARRALLQAGWAVPVVLALGMPQNAYAVAESGGGSFGDTVGGGHTDFHNDHTDTHVDFHVDDHGDGGQHGDAHADNNNGHIDHHDAGGFADGHNDHVDNHGDHGDHIDVV
jgi:hypothetical protein